MRSVRPGLTIRLCAGLVVALAPAALAQPPAAVPAREPVQGADTTIRALVEAIVVGEKSLREQPDERKLAELARLRRDLEGITTGVDLDSFESTPRTKIDLVSELQDLLEPLIKQLQAATEEPRLIERLRTQIAYHEERERLAKQALAKVLRLLGMATTDHDVRAELGRIQRIWEGHRAAAVNQLAVARTQLEQRLESRKSLTELTRSTLDEFFRERGRNLLYAVLAFLAVFFGLRLASRPVQRWSQRRRSKAADAPFYLRLVKVAYHALVILAAVAAALIVLYAAGEWGLLAMALLVLLGVVWASRQALPRYFQQVRFALNLGTVRERERVEVNGLPWRVDRLGFSSRLVNPALSGGVLNLPLGELVGKHSRPSAPQEPWFPCREGDLVALSDGTRGRVALQTPEVVQLVHGGGARTTYRTAAFLGLSPRETSSGFVISAVFGIDYAHQAAATREVPQRMAERLRAALGEAVGASLRGVGVEFKQAAASSLDYEVFAEFNGDVADREGQLLRLIHGTLVDLCNDQGWSIPFPQLTIHQARG